MDLIACKISIRLSFLKWNDSYHISELMLPTLIRNNHFIFYPIQKRETKWNFTGCQRPHFFMILLILYINLFNLSWIKKNVYFWGIWSLKVFSTICVHGSHLVQWCSTIWTNWQYPFNRRPNLKSVENWWMFQRRRLKIIWFYTCI